MLFYAFLYFLKITPKQTNKEQPTKKTPKTKQNKRDCFSKWPELLDKTFSFFNSTN